MLAAGGPALSAGHLALRPGRGLRPDRPTAAEEVYRAALARFPENGFALKGLAGSLAAQGRDDEADEVRARLVEAWREADVELPGSRF